MCDHIFTLDLQNIFCLFCSRIKHNVLQQLAINPNCSITVKTLRHYVLSNFLVPVLTNLWYKKIGRLIISGLEGLFHNFMFAIFLYHF